MAHILGKAFLAQWLELRSYNPQGPRGMGLNLRHDIQDPGWQWSGARELPERRWRRGSLDAGDHFLRGRGRPRAESSEQWEPECLHCAGGAASPCAVQHRSGVRPVNVPLHGTRAGCKDSSSRCRCEVPRAFEKFYSVPMAKRSRKWSQPDRGCGQKAKRFMPDVLLSERDFCGILLRDRRRMLTSRHSV